MGIKKRTIETYPDGRKVETIEYDTEEKQFEFDWWKTPVEYVRTPCAFDNLPPGAYGLVCTCQRCSPRCVATSIVT